MALANTLLRRAASRAVPLAMAPRVFQATPRYNNHSSALFATVKRSTDLSTLLFQRSSPFSSSLAHRHFSAQPAPAASDEKILQILKDEITAVKESKVPEAWEAYDPENPFPFSFQSHHEKQISTLAWDNRGEHISIEVDTNHGGPFNLPLVVRVSKNDGICFEFGIIGKRDEISIHRFSVRSNRDSVESESESEGHIAAIEYEWNSDEGPELDENLENAVQEYLEIKRIKPKKTMFLQEFMLTKGSKDVWVMHQSLKKFMEACLD